MPGGLVRGYTRHLTPVSPSAARTDPLDRGLVGEWRFDPVTGLRLPDYSGYGCHGTLSGPDWVATQYGPALDFEQANQDVVNITGSRVYITSGSPFSVEAFVWLESLGGGYPMVALLRTDGTHSWQYFFSNDGSYSDLTFGSNTTFADLKIDIPGTVTGTWWHTVIAYNGGGAGVAGNYSFYLNGNTRTLASSGGVGATDQASQFSYAASSDAWDGLMACFRVYRRELSLSEARARYQICLKRAQPMTHVSMLPFAFVAAPPPTIVPVVMHHYRTRRV